VYVSIFALPLSVIRTAAGATVSYNVQKLGEGGFPYTSVTDKYIEKFRSKERRSQPLSPRFVLYEVRTICEFN
jgi:hypothetical protein